MPTETMSPTSVVPRSRATKSKIAVAPPPQQSLSIELDFARVRYSAETARPHVLFAPMHYEAGYAYPLIVWLHDAANNERQVMRIMPNLSMRNYVAIAPQGMPQTAQRYDWSNTDDGIAWSERAVFESIDLAMLRCNIAPHRTYLVGSGSGGTMALQLAMRFPKTFAGVVSIGGGLPSGSAPLRSWTEVRRLSVLLITGEQSEHFTPTDATALWGLFHTAGIPATLKQYAAADGELTPEMLQEINRHIMNHVCGNTVCSNSTAA